MMPMQQDVWGLQLTGENKSHMLKLELTHRRSENLDTSVSVFGKVLLTSGDKHIISTINFKLTVFFLFTAENVRLCGPSQVFEIGLQHILTHTQIV